jgi:DGQHR domain-containing protein
MQETLPLLDPDKQDVRFRAIKATQPIGDLYIASVPHEVLGKIAYFDVRRVLQQERDVERYLGIQRPLNPTRVKELEKYVNFRDATFPTAIIIAVADEYVVYEEDTEILEIRNYREGEDAPSARIREIARVIDGQHRIAGLYAFKGERFEVPVTVFVGSDISDQGYVFATVNLEQTKVSKSLAYDLFALAQTRSPQRTAHQIAVALDSDQHSPFYHKIKRLGIATPGRKRGELITQATFVEMLLAYISTDAKGDRDTLLRGGKLDKISSNRTEKMIFRNMFIDERDIDIGRIIFNYFTAISKKWPEDWENRERGNILNKTNGFRAFMRVLRPLYQKIALPGNIPSVDKFYEFIDEIPVPGTHFTIENYVPGTSGESELRGDLLGWLGLEDG